LSLLSAFNAQGLRVIVVIVQEGAVKIYTAAVKALRKKKRQDELSIHSKVVEKLVWVPVISFSKNFVPS
jgi:hypothetical protein